MITNGIKELRERTSVSVGECHQALKQANGDVEQAIKILRENGKLKAQARAEKAVSKSIISTYNHDGRIAVCVEVAAETDFALNSNEVKQFMKEICLQIAAMKPSVVHKNEIDEDSIKEERETLRQQTINEGKPEKIVEKIVDGKMQKYFNEVCLLNQIWIKDSSLTIEQLLNDVKAKTGENIVIKRFVRMEANEMIIINR